MLKRTTEPPLKAKAFNALETVQEVAEVAFTTARRQKSSHAGSRWLVKMYDG